MRRVPKLLTRIATGALVCVSTVVPLARAVPEPEILREIVRSVLYGGTAEEMGAGVAIGIDGAAYLVGTSSSRDYPASDDRRLGPGGGTDVFVTKMGSDGDVAWSAIVGGSGNDSGAGIAVDAAGAAVITGTSASSDFPSTPGSPKPCDGSPAAFVARLNPTGRGTTYSSCLGAGSKGAAVTIDNAGTSHVVGSTGSANVPVTSATAYQATAPGAGDAFLAVVQSTGAIQYATYLGGGAADTGTGVAVGDDGSVWLTGHTCSTDFPVVSATQAAPGGACDAFVSRFDPSKPGAAGLVLSSYLGGSDEDGGAAIALDGDGAPHVTGFARSNNFPVTPSAAQSTKGEGNCFIPGKGAAVSEQYVTPRNCADAFVAKLTATGSVIQYSTYLGGTGAPDPPKSFTRCLREGCNRGDDFGTALFVGDSGEVVVTGRTVSAELPTTPGALQSSYSATDCRNTTLPGQQYRSPQPCPDAFFAVLGSGGELHYATYLGGNRGDAGTAVAKGPGGAFVAGTTNSNDFPVVGAIPPDSTGSTEAFLTKIGTTAPGPPAPVPLIEHLSVRSGPGTGGTEVVVSGRRFTGVSQVRFGDTPASFRVDGAGALVAVAPAHAPGRVAVRIVSSAGTSLPNSASSFDYGEGGWSSAGRMSVARPGGHTATALADGRILVTGGCCIDGAPMASAEIFDPATGRWSITASMGMARFDHTATLLRSGKVVVAGGIGPGLVGGIHGATTKAELYDPATGAWTPTGDLYGPCVVLPAGATDPGCGARYGHSATLLDDGTVLAVGGEGTNNGVYLAPVRYADLFHENLIDPATGRLGTWVPTAPLNDARAFHSATLLQPGRSSASCGLHCGKVLVAAGISNVFNQPRPEMYDPLTRRWTFTEFYPFNAPVYAFHSATAPGDGSVVFAGGNIGATGGGGVDTPRHESYVLEPAANTYRPAPIMAVRRYGHAAVALPSGRVLVAGGYNLGPLRSAEVYDPATSTWASAGSMRTARGMRDAAIPPDPLCPTNEEVSGICGGGAQGQPIYSTPGPTAALITGDLATCGARCGTVLVVGGVDSDSAELYTPLPTVTGVSPAKGSTAGGTVVTLTGTGLGNGPRLVRFGGATVSCPGPDCSVLANDSLRVRAPAAASPGAVEVDVTTVGGASPANPGARFTYLPDAPAAILDPCSATPKPGAGQVVYPRGYSLVGLPGGSLVAAHSALYGWFNQGSRGTYTSQDATAPVVSGRGYWAWSSCPFLGLVNEAGTTSATVTLSAYHASMVGNPSSSGSATIDGHDFAVRWDPQLENGAGGYILSGYREQLDLRVGEGAWVFAYRDAAITLTSSQ